MHRIRKILIDIFHSRLEDISYLDIGANKWRHGSNTYLFYGKCKGTLVEADPVLADKLRRKRKADQIYNVAVSTKENESLKFYILSLATRSSLDKKHVEEEMKRGIKLIKTIQIKCETVNNIIAKNKNVPDFLSLDIEGMDFQVLQTIDYKKYKIKVIVAENSNERNAENETMDQFMNRQGYEIYCKTKANTVYKLSEKAIIA